MRHEQTLVKRGSPRVDSSRPVKVEHSQAPDQLSDPEASSRADVKLGCTSSGTGFHFDLFCEVENLHVFTAGPSLHKSSFQPMSEQYPAGSEELAVRRHKDNLSADLASRKSIVLGAVDFLRSQPALSGQKIGVIGFSMGGAWALSLSTARPVEVGAVVVFYGTEPADFSKTQASFPGGYAPEDEWEPLEGIRELETKLREAGREVTFHYYPGDKTLVFEENTPGDYDPAAASLVWNRTLEFLNGTLKYQRSSPLSATPLSPGYSGIFPDIFPKTRAEASYEFNFVRTLFKSIGL